MIRKYMHVWISLCFALCSIATAVAVNVESEPTAYLYDSTQFDLTTYTTVAMRMIRFRDGTVCVVAKSYNSSDTLQLECDFSRSATVQVK